MFPEVEKTMNRQKQTSSGMGLWLLLGIAVGAAACYGAEMMCGTPTKHKVRRRLMHAADAVNDAIDNLFISMK